MQQAGKEHGLDVVVEHTDNPRVEMEEHYYNPTHTKLLDLGLKPRLLSDSLIEHMFDVMTTYKDRVLPDRIDPKTRWKPPAPSAQPAG